MPPSPLYVGRCGPDAAAQLQPISDTCGAQRALLPIIAVGSMNINELINIIDVCESATIFPRHCKLTFDLLNIESGVRVTCDVEWTTSVPILVFLGLSVRNLGPMYTTDRRQTASSLNAPA